MQAYKISSRTVTWSPSMAKFAILGSISACFVSLIDLNSSPISSSVYCRCWSNFQFKSIFQQKRLQLLENIGFFFKSFDCPVEIVQIIVVLNCLCCNWRLVHIVNRDSLESVVCTCWWTLLHQKHETDTPNFALNCSLLGAKGIWGTHLGTCTCRNIDSISAVRLIVPSRNMNIVPINLCSKSLSVFTLSFSHISMYFAAALQTRRTCLSSLQHCVLNTIPFLNCLCLPIYRGSSRILFQHLYQLTIATIPLNLGLVGIFVSVSRVNLALSRSYLEGLVLDHFIARQICIVLFSTNFWACSFFIDCLTTFILEA